MYSLNKMENDAHNAKRIADLQRKKEIAESWHPQQEKLIRIWGEKCLGYRWLHDRTAKYHSVIHRNMSIATIMGSAVAGIGTMTASGSGGMIIPATMYAFSMINLATAALASIHKFLRSGEKYEANLQISKMFSGLARDITMELSLEKEDRVLAFDYCNKIRLEYDKLIDIAPDIPEEVIKKYKEMMELEDPEGIIHKPDVANGKFKIYSSYSYADV